MFWKKKRKAETVECEYQEQVEQLKIDIEVLSDRIKKLECTHNFICVYSGQKLSQRCIVFKCNKCGKRIIKTWKQLKQKEQQALNALNLVPNDWKMKGTEDE